ncbi:MAG: nascent polypeptide-associated complex protein [Candidatus Nezhaarchaeales archaeon]|nr:MAG: nascent polypeptide-associated complex protein [Candidatus Nezhaarchaeota archaeon WYZ-LMO8]TDA36802.1 MAG: nascent polypeptide-associated complex protein [Candidatus Nezhaarchaeota archaeon WYZ-LMO7]
MKGISPRELQKMLHVVKKAGLSIEQVEGVESVVFRLRDKEIVIRNPQVTSMKVGNQTIFQVTGEVEERSLVVEEVSISEEDVQLVASQAGVSLEEARKALKATKGDLARAILYLRGM